MRKLYSKRKAGFTLIEMMLALSIFSLILFMGYQSIVVGAQSRHALRQGISQQDDLRGAYNSLVNAVQSLAPMTGSRRELIFDLSQSDSLWLEGVGSIRFVITNGQTMTAFLDGSINGSVLLDNLSNAEFSFFEHGKQLEDSYFSSADTIRLSWMNSGKPIEWWFLR